MSLRKPYYRIWRPFIDAKTHPRHCDYLRDPRNAKNASDLIRGYLLLEKELIRNFEFIEPCDAHLTSYSHQLYSLLLRASTEFEANAKGVLIANEYSPKGDWTIKDYQKLDSAMRLSDYTVIVHAWSGQNRVVQPFKQWSSPANGLPWYRAYNKVKHNRADEFSSASLENVVNAIAGVFAILFSQFHIQSFHPVHTGMYFTDDDDDAISHSTSMFGIRLPSTWSVADSYDFDWDTLKASPMPFVRYSF